MKNELDIDPAVLPSRSAYAVVRHAAPPVSAPTSLAPFTIRVDEDGVSDWLLTEDAVAFGESSVVQEFAAWRGEWERSWMLEPLGSLGKLRRLAVELDSGPDSDGRDGEQLLRKMATGPEHVVVPPESQKELAKAAAAVAVKIRTRGATGFGIVDDTPDREWIGLAHTWSPYGEAEVIAADEHLELKYEPVHGLVVTIHGHPDLNPMSAVAQVEFDGSQVVITAADGRQEGIHHHQARPLAWLVPGSTRWRVHPIPEIVVWSKTFAGVEECCTYASALDLPMQLTTRQPISTELYANLNT